MLSLLVAAGCALAPGRSAALDGTWHLTTGAHHGEPVPIVAPGSVTLTIDGPEIGGRAACNIYGGAIDIDNGRITISALSMTEMACEEELMASEAAYLAALGAVGTAERTGDGLVLAGPDVELRFTRMVAGVAARAVVRGCRSAWDLAGGACQRLGSVR